MKKIIFYLVAVLAFSPLYAQQALWGAEEIVSPEIHPDKRVTFRLRAPQASVVQVTGDCLPSQQIETPFGMADAPGIRDLVKNKEGVWEYTTNPLEPELYSYSFIVDGVKVNDPGNVYMIRDVASVTSVFIIDGGYAGLYKVNKVPHGTVARRWYHSASLGYDRRITIYTPPGYESDEATYPVLYLLHGMGGDEEAWIALGRTAQILDNLIALGKVTPMIVVMPNGNVDQEAAPGESSWGMYKPTMHLPRTMEGTMEQTFPEIISFIESNYRTINDRSGRAIAGLSMGGFHSLNISREYPDLFDYVGLFSAAILPNDQVQSPIYENPEGKLRMQFQKNPKLYWIGIGKTDFLYQNNVEYRKLLDQKGYPYIYFENEEGHIWKNWRIYLSQFTSLLFKD